MTKERSAAEELRQAEKRVEDFLQRIQKLKDEVTESGSSKSPRAQFCARLLISY